MNAVPPLLFIPNGSWPGCEFGVCSAKVVRGAEVKSIRSLGSGTKPFVSSSITQLSQRAYILLSKVGFDKRKHLGRGRKKYASRISQDGNEWELRNRAAHFEQSWKSWKTSQRTL